MDKPQQAMALGIAAVISLPSLIWAGHMLEVPIWLALHGQARHAELLRDQPQGEVLLKGRIRGSGQEIEAMASSDTLLCLGNLGINPDSKRKVELQGARLILGTKTQAAGSGATLVQAPGSSWIPLKTFEQFEGVPPFEKPGWRDQQVILRYACDELKLQAATNKKMNPR